MLGIRTGIGVVAAGFALTLTGWGAAPGVVAHDVGLATVQSTFGIAEAPMFPAELHGDPDLASDYWNQQNFQDCGLMAVATVVGLTTGTAPTEEEIIAVASGIPSPTRTGSPIYTPADPNNPDSDNGTSSDDQVLLLRHYGINATATDDDMAADTGLPTGIPALVEYLDDGHMLIVGVNAETIWAEEGGYTDDNHSVVVSGLDPELGIVYLSDSGTEDGDGEEIPVDVFERAWATGAHDLIVAG